MPSKVGISAALPIKAVSGLMGVWRQSPTYSQPLPISPFLAKPQVLCTLSMYLPDTHLKLPFFSHEPSASCGCQRPLPGFSNQANCMYPVLLRSCSADSYVGGDYLAEAWSQVWLLCSLLPPVGIIMGYGARETETGQHLPTGPTVCSEQQTPM